MNHFYSIKSVKLHQQKHFGVKSSKNRSLRDQLQATTFTAVDSNAYFTILNVCFHKAQEDSHIELYVRVKPLALWM